MRLLPVLPLFLLFLTNADRRAPESVSYRAGKATVRGTLYRPDGAGPWPAMVVVHGEFGPNTWVKKQAERLSEKGFVALAVDLYRGELPRDVEEAHILERALVDDQVLANLRGAVDLLEGRPDVSKGAVGILGWDTGAGYALDAAIRDRRLRAAVVCYGRLTTDARELAGLQGAVLGIFGERDEGISAETLGQFREAMKKAGKRLDGLHVYPGCGNGFLDPSSPYDSGKAPAAAVADAWSKIDAFLAAELKR